MNHPVAPTHVFLTIELPSLYTEDMLPGGALAGFRSEFDSESDFILDAIGEPSIVKLRTETLGEKEGSVIEVWGSVCSASLGPATPGYGLTRDCDCPPVIKGMGAKRPTECWHGNRYQTEAELRTRDLIDTPQLGPVSSPRRRYKKSSEPKRDWSLAVQKKEDENDCCRACGAHGTEAAHILGRRHDQPIAPGSRTLLVLPDRIVPLCPRCHRDFDAHSLDLLSFLGAAEQAQAVLDAGGIESARRRLAPSAYVESLAS